MGGAAPSPLQTSHIEAFGTALVVSLNRSVVLSEVAIGRSTAQVTRTVRVVMSAMEIGEIDAAEVFSRHLSISPPFERRVVELATQEPPLLQPRTPHG
jgi:hypothetical protein